MKSDMCKVLHPVAGRPMLAYVLDAVKGAGLGPVTLVVGHQADRVADLFSDANVQFVEQHEQWGTGHAVQSAKETLGGFDGHIMILCGDTPLITADNVTDFMTFHRNSESRLTVLTTVMTDPTGYGRIVRDDNGAVLRIVEQRDASEAENAINEINTGMYLAEASLLFELVDGIGADNDQGEYYLTDIVGRAVEKGVTVHGYRIDDSERMTGVNTRSELAEVSRKIWELRRRDLMLSGVTLLDPQTVYVDHDVEIGIDTVVHPNVTLAGNTKIGGSCVIEPGVMITDCVIGDGVEVRLGSRLELSSVGNGAVIGPMAHLRPETEIGADVRIGNFVELKKSSVGARTKAAHLTYLGDADIGKDVNIGCGVITCNYDGKKKYRTIVGDRAFVGADVQLKAPIDIGEGSYIGAGSTITKDVPPRTLAVSRSKQRVYPLREDQDLHKDD